MQVPATSVLLATLVIAAAAAVVTPAGAKDLSDVAYLQASRCAGLAQGSAVDTKQIDAMLKDQSRGREGYVLDRADETRSDAVHQARRASGYAKQAVATELSGACQAYISGAQMGQSASSGVSK